jgi:hypothetical protein
MDLRNKLTRETASVAAQAMIQAIPKAAVAEASRLAWRALT